MSMTENYFEFVFHLSCQDSNYYDQKSRELQINDAMMLACSEVPVSSSAKAFYPTRTYCTTRRTLRGLSYTIDFTTE